MRRFNRSLTFLILSCAVLVGCHRSSADLSPESFDDPAVAKMIQNHKLRKLMKNPRMNRRVSSTNMSSGDRAKFMAYMMEANKEIMKMGN